MQPAEQRKERSTSDPSVGGDCVASWRRSSAARRAASRSRSATTPILRGVDLDDPRGRLRGARRAERLRQVDAAAPRRRARGGRRGDDRARRPRRHRSSPPRDRDVAMVFQSYALYPHLTVRENLAFGLKLRGDADGARSTTRIDEASAMLGLDAAARAPPEAALRRPAPARRDGPRDRAAADDLPLRRAALEPRRRAARRGARRDPAPARSPRRDDALRHARSGRGDDARRPLWVLNGGLVEQKGAPLEVYERPRDASSSRRSSARRR